MAWKKLFAFISFEACAILGAPTMTQWFSQLQDWQANSILLTLLVLPVFLYTPEIIDWVRNMASKAKVTPALPADTKKNGSDFWDLSFWDGVTIFVITWVLPHFIAANASNLFFEASLFLYKAFGGIFVFLNTLPPILDGKLTFRNVFMGTAGVFMVGSSKVMVDWRVAAGI